MAYNANYVGKGDDLLQRMRYHGPHIEKEVAQTNLDAYHQLKKQFPGEDIVIIGYILPNELNTIEDLHDFERGVITAIKHIRRHDETFMNIDMSDVKNMRMTYDETVAFGFSLIAQCTQVKPDYLKRHKIYSV